MSLSNYKLLTEQIQYRLDHLTKPIGSLGEIENLAARYCSIIGQAMPPLPRKWIYIFCADHGVVDEGVSLYPAEVTRQMALNFQRGGAAINVLCRTFGITPVIVNAGVSGEDIPGILDRRVGSGTRNFRWERAMSREQAVSGIEAGRALAQANEPGLVGVGEMGIGNTTSAAAVFAALTGRDPLQTVGRGTGLDAEGVSKKAEVIRESLNRHCPDARDPIDVLSAVGGFEIAMIAGFLLGATKKSLPVVIDGYITTVAALVATRLDASALDTAFFSHQSAEAGHRALLDELGVRAPLDLGMRLGEGTGAALAINLIETSLRLYREMATFGEAQVSGPEV